MNFTLVIAFSLSIYIAGIVAVIRLKKINKVYYPFLISIWLGCLSELVNSLLAEKNLNSYTNINLYILFETLLIVLFFRNLGLFQFQKKLFYTIIGGLIAGWIIENIIVKQIDTIAIYFTIYSSLIIVLLSVTILNKLIVSSRRTFITNPVFLLCIAFIIYFTYQVMVYAFWIYAPQSDASFLLKIFSIMIYINLLTNLIYALAVLWMHKKQEFTLPS
ncbi:MAG: hypothetical protein WKF85_14365 [Chitinophagaceae bacterium]